MKLPEEEEKNVEAELGKWVRLNTWTQIFLTLLTDQRRP
jgi:hypothetical protein